MWRGRHIDGGRSNGVGFGGVGMVEVVRGACAKWVQRFNAPAKTERWGSVLTNDVRGEAEFRWRMTT
jgi:hypothetical protein